MVRLESKKTPARLAIKEYLHNVNIPAGASDILHFLRSKNLNTNKVTVYRVLDFLYKNGVIERLEFGEGKFRYELKKNHHHHLICLNCGKIEDVRGEFLKKTEDKIYKDKKFIVKNHSLEFYGMCENCQN